MGLLQANGRASKPLTWSRDGNFEDLRYLDKAITWSRLEKWVEGGTILGLQLSATVSRKGGSDMKIYIPILLFLAIGLPTMAPQGLEAKTVEVLMTSSLLFDPADVTINIGDSIRWRNAALGNETTTSGENCRWDGLLWNVCVTPGQTYERVFKEAGVFPYFSNTPSHCEFGMVGTITVNEIATMALPQSQVVFTPAPSSAPVLNTDPALANPIGLGSVAAGGDTLDIRIGTTGFSGSAEVYFAVSSPQVLGNEIFLYSGGMFVAFSSAGIVPWIASTTEPLDQDLFGAIPVSSLPSGDYTLFFAVAPAGTSLATFFYLWSAVFTIPWAFRRISLPPSVFQRRRKGLFFFLFRLPPWSCDVSEKEGILRDFWIVATIVGAALMSLKARCPMLLGRGFFETRLWYFWNGTHRRVKRPEHIPQARYFPFPGISASYPPAFMLIWGPGILRDLAQNKWLTPLNFYHFYLIFLKKILFKFKSLLWKEYVMKKMILALALAVAVGVTFYGLQADAQMGYGMMGPGYGYGPQGGYQGQYSGSGYGGYGMGPGMMGGCGGYGMGPGMMGGYGGYGMGPGMMGGYGGMGPGMMGGYGYGGQYGPQYGAPQYGPQYGPPQYGPQSQQPQKPLDKDQAKQVLENYLRSTRNPNLKLGDMKDEGSYFEGDIVTKKEGSLADKLAVDKDTGWIHPLY
jgi:plastocyanin